LHHNDGAGLARTKRLLVFHPPRILVLNFPTLDGRHFALQSDCVTTSQGTMPKPGIRLSALAVWLCAFISPTAYFLLLLLVNRFQVPAPPEILVASLFFLVPVVALLVCFRIAWVSSKSIARRIGWMTFTLIAMLLQFGALLVIIIAVIGAAIGYAQ
jgi:hypothetical protein